MPAFACIVGDAGEMSSWRRMTPGWRWSRKSTIDPDLPICDPHHHLWDHREGRIERRYLLDEIQRDLQSGHNVVSTVFIEHLAMYRADGPEEMKYVGEVEFANGIAAMAASGLYGKTKVAAGIIGYADLATGSRVRAVLEAEIAAAPDRFRGIRCTGAWDPDPRIARAPRPGLVPGREFSRRLRRARCARPDLRS